MCKIEILCIDKSAIRAVESAFVEYETFELLLFLFFTEKQNDGDSSFDVSFDKPSSATPVFDITDDEDDDFKPFKRTRISTSSNSVRWIVYAFKYVDWNSK